MRMRESGMPEEEFWETLFDVTLILDRLGIDNTVRDMVELGCGYGTFAIPVARRISGLLRTYDIEPDMVARTTARAAEAKVQNVVCLERDVFAEGFDVPARSQDGCLLFNILHCEDPVRVLMEGARVVREGGHVFVIHWRYDPATPRGPRMEIRPRPETIADWANGTGLLAHEGGILDLPPWHYGLRLTRVRTKPATYR